MFVFDSDREIRQDRTPEIILIAGTWRGISTAEQGNDFMKLQSSTTTPRRAFWMRAGLIGLALGGAFVVWRHEDASSAELATLRGDVSKLTSARPDTKVVIREIRTEPSQPATAPEPAPSAPAPSTPAPGAQAQLSEADKQHRQLVQNEAAEKLCAETHAKEPVDAGWSQVAAKLIADTYSGEEFRALRVTPDCRSTLCRVDFTYSDPITGQAAAVKFAHVQPWEGTRFTHMNTDTHTGSSYFAREGLELPKLDLATLQY
jgi:hypothetical protein